MTKGNRESVALMVDLSYLDRFKKPETNKLYKQNSSKTYDPTIRPQTIKSHPKKRIKEH